MLPPATPAPAPPRWLLLVHQLPAQPSLARVRTWRRLQSLGALALRNSVYLLPHSPRAREDFEWMRAEIVAMKGQASVFAADAVDELTGDEIVAAFRSSRHQSFQAIRRQAESLRGRLPAGRVLRGPRRLRLERAARRLRDRWERTRDLDYFGSPGREEAAAALEALERVLAGGDMQSKDAAASGGTLMTGQYRDRTWVTRPRPGVDRMASAWLIRRFIDPQARFSFADRAEDPVEVPFDMYGVEFSHQGNECTFEALVRRFGIAHPAVAWLGQLVHQLDLRDETYAVSEAPAVGRMIDGLRQIEGDDHALLERGITMFEALYRSFGDPHAKPAGSVRLRRRRGVS